jgi:hypothetical protein
MQRLKNLVVLRLLLAMIITVGISDYAYGEMPKIRMPTDNGSTFVDVSVNKGMVTDNTFTIDPPQEVKFDIVFLHPGAFDEITHVNYQFHIADASGNMIVHKTKLHVHDGMDTQSVTFSNTGSFTLTIVIEGTGISQPYDTANSGTASVTISVTPEFPFVMAIIATLVGISLAATRFRERFKL